MKTATKNHIWNKEGRVVGNNKIHYCVPVDLTALGVFRTPQEAMVHLNNAARQIQERGITMTTAIKDHNTMCCPRAVHVVGAAMGWTLRKVKKLSEDKSFEIADQGMFLVVGIQNTHFKVGQQKLRLGNDETCHKKTQPRLNRHAVIVIDSSLFIMIYIMNHYLSIHYNN